MESQQPSDEPRQWTPDEVKDFRRLYGSRSDRALARRFGTNVEEIQRLAAHYRLSKDKAAFRGSMKMPRWSAEELIRLREVYPTHSNLEIARELDRSVKSVVSKAHQLGLHKDPERLRDMGRENVVLRRPENGGRRPDFIAIPPPNEYGEQGSMP